MGCSCLPTQRLCHPRVFSQLLFFSLYMESPQTFHIHGSHFHLLPGDAQISSSVSLSCTTYWSSLLRCPINSLHFNMHKGSITLPPPSTHSHMTTLKTSPIQPAAPSSAESGLAQETTLDWARPAQIQTCVSRSSHQCAPLSSTHTRQESAGLSA